MLRIEIQGASDLKNQDYTKKSDPYCLIKFQGRSEKTKTVEKNLNPAWNEVLEFELKSALNGSEILELEIKDENRFERDTLMGKATISIRSAVKSGRQAFPTQALVDKSGKPTQGTVNLIVSYTSPLEKERSGKLMEIREGDKSETIIGSESIKANEWEIIGQDLLGEKDSALSGLESNKSLVARANKFKRRQARVRLPNEPVDFQLQVHCIEARRLAGGGGNLSPSCVINVGSQTKSTSSVDSSINPVWDEILTFYFKMKPEELFNTMLLIKVVNSKFVIMENLIGSFQMDIGIVYDEVDHGFVQRWLLLTNMSDPSAGPKGYLKLSLQLIGPGDSPAPLPPYDPGASYKDDIEGNLLRPAGINLQPATFKIRIFKAEDVPQMDPAYLETVKKTFDKSWSTEAKNLVDPYVSVSYSGHTVSTGVRWKTCNPDWNESLQLGTRFPSMSERIQIRLYDKDKTSQDDIIGTAFLYLSDISMQEGDKGFLPTFGPAWINFYGSTREYKHIGSNYGHLNEGLYEGVAFRGRLLMQLNTELGKYPNSEQSGHISRQKALVKGLKRHRHRLYVAFFHATQLEPHSSQVSFEVSIGNYGYREDPNAIIAPSTTQPTKPVTENNVLYFLPWGSKKPCCVIPCYWENNIYRIESMNILNHIADQLENNIKGVKEMIETEEADLNDISQAIVNMLEKLSSDLSEQLPVLPRDLHTMLDIQWFGLRDSERLAILNAIPSLRDITDQEEMLYICEGFVNRIRVVAVESQISIPDIIIWMIHGSDRVAVTRIPAHEIYYSQNPIAKGSLCGKIHTRFLRVPCKDVDHEIQPETKGQLRLAAWLGIEKNTFNWEECIPGASVLTYAETYENQMFSVTSWAPAPLGLIPAWSDSTGKMNLLKDSFVIPQGWRWDRNWFVSTAEDIEYDPEFKLKEIMEETYEVITKDDDTLDWDDAKIVWEDENGDPSTAPDRITPPNGWDWKESDWTVDINRAVDEEGWEYGNDADSREAFNSIERADSIVKRRRIIRVRVKKTDQAEESRQSQSDDGQWEYATTIKGPWHRMKSITHILRRRRWLKRMVATEKNASNIFSIAQSQGKRKSQSSSSSSIEQKIQRESPRIFMYFEEEYKWMLRAYIYQARTLLSGDRSGLSDPYAQVSISTSCEMTRTVHKTLCPTWNQTLFFNEITIYGAPELTKASPPLVVVSIFDKDMLMRNETLGQSIIQPEVKLNVDGQATKLKWHNIKHRGRDVGQLLASFDLILLDREGKNLKRVEALELSAYSTYYKIPESIRPQTQLMRIEILLWGVRDMKKFELTSVNQPFVRISCGDKMVDSEPIKNSKINPNFPNPSIHLECELPKELIYMPPLQIQVLDKRLFGRTPIVGVHSISSLKPFMVHTPAYLQQLNVYPNLRKQLKQPVDFIQVEEKALISTGKSIEDALFTLTVSFDTGSIDSAEIEMEYSDFDWWSRYYATIGDERRSSGFESNGYEKMTYYKGELERWFENFGDRTKDFKLTRGKSSNKKSEVTGLFKGDIKVYLLPENNSEQVPLIFRDIPEHGINEVTVRVYVIRGKQLTAQDPFGKSDPYIKIVLGEKEMINDKANYIPNSLNPLFGKVFVFNTFIPQEHEMRVVVMDHDATSADDLIGYTAVDLENRFLSSFQATCGIPKLYYIAGPCKWRHQLLPSELLDKYLKGKDYKAAKWIGNTEVIVYNQNFKLKEDFERNGLFPDITNKIDRKILMRQMGGQKQRLALHVLNLFDHVPDHIEERKLINPIQGEVPQGYLEMFVDIFPKADGPLPQELDTAVRQPEDMVLRIIIWNTKDVQLLDNPLYQDDPSSDIYVKAFLRGQNKSKSTDVHYRSMNGEGMFNWRLVFPFKYLPIEQEIVINEKEHFWKLDGTEKRVEPELVLQIWDNDQFLPDDFIGNLEFKLNSFYKPSRHAMTANLNDITPRVDFSNADNLFKRKRLRGWWPVVKVPDGITPQITGKIEMEVEILTAEEATDKPAGEGRDEPNANPFLVKPDRPVTSFAWFTSPFKSFKYIIWRHYKKWIILFTILLAPVMLFLLILL